MDSNSTNRHDPPDTAYLPSYTPSQRAPPPSGPPPAYAAAIQRVYPYTLRPVVLFTTFITFLYLVLIGISKFQDIGDASSTGTSNVYDVVQGVLFVVAALVVALGFVGALRQATRLSGLYARLAGPAYLLVVGAQVVGLVSHYSLKRQTIDACSTNYTGASYRTGSWWWNQQSSGILTAQQAREYCNDRWRSESTWAIVWLVVTVIIGIPFVAFAFGYTRQLRDPASVRIRIGRNQHQPQHQPQQPFNAPPYDPQAQAFAMHAYPYHESRFNPPAYPPPHERDSDADYDDIKSPVTQDRKDSSSFPPRDAHHPPQSTSARRVSDDAPRI